MTTEHPAKIFQIRAGFWAALTATIVFFICASFCMAHAASAAVLSIDAPAKVHVGDTFPIKVMLNTENQTVNALDESVITPPQFVTVISDTYNGSFMKYFINQFSYDPTSGLTGFEGGLPTPGINSINALVVSIYMKAISPGTALFSIAKNPQVLLNDGAATPAAVTETTASTVILPAPKGYIPVTAVEPKTYTPISTFAPVVSKSSTAFGGKYFLTVNNPDNADIDHYEVAEVPGSAAPTNGSVQLNWKTVSMPYVLQNQSGNVSIFVKAVDKLGNEDIEWTSFQHSSNAVWEYIFLIFILLIIVAFLWAPIRYALAVRRNGPPDLDNHHSA